MTHVIFTKMFTQGCFIVTILSNPQAIHNKFLQFAHQIITNHQIEQSKKNLQNSKSIKLHL